MDASPLLDLPGAVAAEPPDAAVAAHYGDPFREQRAATEGCGVVDRSHRDVLRIGGDDRLSWLHSLTTQHLADLPAWRAAEALVLSPHGHVEHHLQLADVGTATYADIEPGTAPALLEFLDAMRFLLRVEPADVSSGHAVLSLTGPTTGEVLAAVGGPLPERPLDVSAGPLGSLVRRTAWPLDPTVDLVVPRATLREVWQQLVAAGASPLGSWGWEAFRVAARQPRLGFETDHRTIPHEVGWLASAVHLDKGCYRGQETVARVHNLGRPPRRLVLLHLDGSVDRLPVHGEAVTSEGAAVGFVGTAVRHHELGPIALALVKRATPDDAVLAAAGIAARTDP